MIRRTTLFVAFVMSCISLNSHAQQRERSLFDIECSYPSWQSADRDEEECQSKLQSVFDRAGDLLKLKLTSGVEKIVTLPSDLDQKTRFALYNTKLQMIFFDVGTAPILGSVGYSLRNGHRTNFASRPLISPGSSRAVVFGFCEGGEVDKHMFAIWEMANQRPKVLWRQSWLPHAYCPTKAAWHDENQITLEIPFAPKGTKRTATVRQTGNKWQLSLPLAPSE